MTQKQINSNVVYLEDYYISVHETGNQFELNNHSRAGGDMVIILDTLDKKSLISHLENFNINEEVLLWWEDKRGSKTPFNNVKEHYEDLEEWRDEYLRIARDMPY